MRSIPDHEDSSQYKKNVPPNFSKNTHGKRMETLTRNFTHITIPAEIWLRKDLSIQAKCLWAEIRSLHDKEVGGCYASEEYLCEFMGLKGRRLREIFKELRDLGLLETVHFDGRKTIRRAIVPDVEYENKKDTSNLLNPIGSPKSPHPSAGGRILPNLKEVGGIPPLRSAESCLPHRQDPALPSYIYKNKEKNKEKKSEVAIAPLSSPSAHDVFVFFLDHLKKRNPKLKEPNRKKWIEELDKIIAIDKRTADELKEVIAWAASQDDDFWPTAIQSPQTLRKLFDRAWTKMHYKSKQQVEKDENAQKCARIAQNKRWAVDTLMNVRYRNTSQKIAIYPTYIMIINGNENTPLGFDTPNFQEIIKNKLKNWGAVFE